MQLINIREQGIFEELFWMEIFGDHARFINRALTVNAQQELEQAGAFIRLFDTLADRANAKPDEGELRKLHKEALEAVYHLRTFKLYLLRKMLTETFEFHLSPTFLNHMVNEAEEGIHVISALAEGKEPPRDHALHHHLVWLQDAVGHADSLDANLDSQEKGLKALTEEYGQHFEWLYLKAVELVGYVRTRLQEFPALNRFNSQVEMEMVLFRKFLEELKEMDIRLEALGTLSPLMIDHMAREECYYLLKLSQVMALTPPACDPAKPRIGR
ncbi:DUF2935 domain-containing protein [Paenibacillus larvae]